jgi:DNA-binding transcriptional LysR family regulator
MRGELNQFVRGTKGTLRMQANTIATTDFIPAILPAFLATHPDIDVNLRERLSPDIVRAVSEDAANIGIVVGDINAEGLEVIPYREDRLMLVTSSRMNCNPPKKLTSCAH